MESSYDAVSVGISIRISVLAKNRGGAEAVKEYSKKIIRLMVLLWFIGAVFGMAVVITQLCTGAYYISLDAIMNYIGLPVGGGIVSYMLKSAYENKEKIKNSGLKPPEEE